MNRGTATATCGEVLIELLEQRGVEVVFGIPGVHTLELYRGLSRSSIRHVTSRHEQGAAFAASGYARVAAKPGVCLLITGPGVTNAATPIASAHHDSQPLLILSSATASEDAGQGRGPLHDLPDQQAFMATITASSETVAVPDQLPGAIERAFKVLEGARPRPVHIGIPVDVLAMPASTTSRATRAAKNREAVALPVSSQPADADLESAAELLAASREPIIVLGGGAIDAGEAALRLSGAVGAPVATSINGKGAISEAHPAALGATVTLQPVFGAIEQADVVLAAGTEFSEVDYYYEGRLPQFSGALIRIDVDPAQLHAGRPATVALEGDAAATMARLATHIEINAEKRGEIAAQRARRLRSRLAWWPGAAGILDVLDAVQTALPEDAIVAADSTQLAYVANSYLKIQRPRSYLCPAGFGTLGPALPMAIGAKLAAPNRPVACLVGDGGLLFTVSELATAAQLGLPIPVIVWNNHGYGEIRDAMDVAQIRHIGTDGSVEDLLLLGRGLGCLATRVERAESIVGALTDALAADRPTLIELPATLAG